MRVVRAGGGYAVPVLVPVLVPALVLVLTAAGCSSTEPSAGPDLGEPVGPTAPSTQRLTELRASAGLPPCPSADGEPSSASDLPTLELGCLDGGPEVDVAGLVGTPYVLNFWASYCATCDDEVPYLQAISDEADGRVRVLGVNYLDLEERALLAAPDFGLAFPTLFDPDGRLGSTFRFQGLPATFFVDAHGAIVGQHVGAFDSADELRDAIERELGVRL